MSIRFRKRVRLFRGAWLNVSKTGVSTSVGGDGVTVNLGKRGTHTTLNVPGTGLRYTSTQARAPTQSTEVRRSGSAARVLAIVLWVFLILYLTWAMR